MTEPLALAGRELRSRLILGTGGFTSHEILAAALAESGAELCTVALRRLDPSARGSILDVLDAERTQLEAEDRLAQSRTDAATSLIAVYKAIGGGWELAPPPHYVRQAGG